MKAIGKYRWYAVIIAWTVAIVGWVVVYALPNDYQASARVYVDTQSVLKPLLSGMTTLPNLDQQVMFMRRTLISRPNVERVMRMVDLDVKATTPKQHEKQIDDLIEKIKITGTERDDIYTISYSNPNPKLGKDVVQSLLTIFVEGSFGGKKQDADKAVQFIDDQIKSYEEKLTQAENELKDFKIKNMGMLPRGNVDYTTSVVDITDKLNQARLELVEAEQSRNAIRRQIGDSGSGKPGAVAASPELDARITQVNKNLDALRMQFTEEHPDIVGAKRLLAQLEEKKKKKRTRVPGTDPGVNYSPMLQQMKVSLSEAEARGRPARPGRRIRFARRAPEGAKLGGAGSGSTVVPAQPGLCGQQGKLPEAGGAPRIGQAVGRHQFHDRHADLPRDRSADRAA
ncbi:hypothetical protein LP420_19030 [Massilia sp. B-10]|nr:hypothetical protein LP420_19030 [Massilia sp. B-10]